MMTLIKSLTGGILLTGMSLNLSALPVLALRFDLVPVLCRKGRADDAGSELVEALEENAVLLRRLVARKLHDGVAVVGRDLLNRLVQQRSGLLLLARRWVDVMRLLARSPGVDHVLQAQQRRKVVEGRA